MIRRPPRSTLFPTRRSSDLERVLGLTTFDPDTTLEVTGGMNRPPYDKDEKISALFEHAKTLAAEIGFELEEVVKTGEIGRAHV